MEGVKKDGLALFRGIVNSVERIFNGWFYMVKRDSLLLQLVGHPLDLLLALLFGGQLLPQLLQLGLLILVLLGLALTLLAGREHLLGWKVEPQVYSKFHNSSER